MQDTAIKPTYSIPELAELVGRDPSTVWRWIQDGQLEAERSGKSYEIPASEVERILKPKRRAADDWLDASLEADALLSLARGGYWPALREIEKQCEKVVEMRGDLKGLTNADQRISDERLETLEGILGDLREALDRRLVYREIYELAGQKRGEAAALEREARAEIDAALRRRREEREK